MDKRHARIATELLSLPTSPFHEQAVAEWARRFATGKLGLPAAYDRWGNLTIRYPGRRTERPLVFAAHMDHPGFAAVRMRRDGLLGGLWMGSVPDAVFAGARVRFFSDGRWVKGRVKSVAPRQGLRTARPAVFSVSEAVAPGSVGMWDFPDARLVGNRIVARGCDDVSGVASLLALLDDAVRARLRTGFQVLLTRAEEAGFMGAIAAARDRLLPRDAVIVAVENSKALPGARIGDGPIIRVGDQAAVFTPRLTAFLTHVAQELARRKKKSFRWQRKLMDGGICESSAYMEYGYESGGLCLPLGNYHNVAPDRRTLRAEYVDINDFENLIALYRAVVERFEDYEKLGGAFRKHCEGLFRRNRDLLARSHAAPPVPTNPATR
jgi:putative aminopeptidase FrvX